MKLLTNGVYRVVPAKREQVLQHIGPAGLRRYTQEVADYEVPGAQADANDGGWETSFVAGDLISVVAGRVGGGPMEISVLDEDGRPVVLSASPNGLCYAGAKIPRSGVYTLHVRHVAMARLMGEDPDEPADGQEQPAPFKLCCTRQNPRLLPARLAPLRGQDRRHPAPGAVQRFVARFASRLGNQAPNRSARAGYA